MTDAVVFVADAGRHAGLGHLSRSTAVAVALRCRGIETITYAHDSERAFERDSIHWLPLERLTPASLSHTLVVIDSYRLSPKDLALPGSVGGLVVMHDHGPVPSDASIVVSMAGEPHGRTRLLRGLRYAALRPHFWGLPARVLQPDVRRILVTTGSGELEEPGRQFARAVASALPGAVVALVRGPHATAPPLPGIETIDAPETLLEPLLEADLAITAGGQTMLEAAATGTPCIALPLVENQRAQVEAASEEGAVRVVDSSKADDVASAVVSLARDLGAREALSATGQRAIDGYGALRVAFEIAALADRTP